MCVCARRERGRNKWKMTRHVEVDSRQTPPYCCWFCFSTFKAFLQITHTCVCVCLYVYVYLCNMHTNVRRQLSVTTATFFFFIFAFCIPTLQINTFALVFSKVSTACVLATISHFSLHTHTHAHFSLNALTASDFGCAILFFICFFFLFLLSSCFICRSFCAHFACTLLEKYWITTQSNAYISYCLHSAHLCTCTRRHESNLVGRHAADVRHWPWRAVKRRRRTKAPSTAKR